MRTSTGTLYHDTSSRGIKHGKRIYANRWVAEITVDYIRYRRVSKDKKVCEKWLDDVISGKIRKKYKLTSK